MAGLKINNLTLGLRLTITDSSRWEGGRRVTGELEHPRKNCIAFSVCSFWRADQSSPGQSTMKVSLELPTWKCPERKTALKWHHTIAEETSAYAEQHQYPTCLSWQSLPDQPKINTNLLKRFRSRAMSIKHIPGVGMLMLQPRSWWAVGGDQPWWLQGTSASPALAAPPQDSADNPAWAKMRPGRATAGW